MNEKKGKLYILKLANKKGMNKMSKTQRLIIQRKKNRNRTLETAAYLVEKRIRNLYIIDI